MNIAILIIVLIVAVYFISRINKPNQSKRKHFPDFGNNTESKTKFRQTFDKEMERTGKEFGVSELDYREKALEMGVFNNENYTEKEFNKKRITELRSVRNNAFDLRVDPDFAKQLKEISLLVDSMDVKAEESAKQLAKMTENKAGNKQRALDMLDEMHTLEVNDKIINALELVIKMMRRI